MMRAKMKVFHVNRHDGYEELTLVAVSRSEGYPIDGSDENNTYAKWTPSAELKIAITNPNLVGKFYAGQTFYVDFTEVK